MDSTTYSNPTITAGYALIRHGRIVEVTTCRDRWISASQSGDATVSAVVIAAPCGGINDLFFDDMKSLRRGIRRARPGSHDPRHQPRIGDKVWHGDCHREVVDLPRGWVIFTQHGQSGMRALEIASWRCLVHGWFFRRATAPKLSPPKPKEQHHA